MPKWDNFDFDDSYEPKIRPASRRQIGKGFHWMFFVVPIGLLVVVFAGYLAYRNVEQRKADKLVEDINAHYRKIESDGIKCDEKINSLRLFQVVSHIDPNAPSGETGTVTNRDVEDWKQFWVFFREYLTSATADREALDEDLNKLEKLYLPKWYKEFIYIERQSTAAQKEQEQIAGDILSQMEQFTPLLSTMVDCGEWAKTIDSQYEAIYPLLRNKRLLIEAKDSLAKLNQQIQTFKERFRSVGETFQFPSFAKIQESLTKTQELNDLVFRAANDILDGRRISLIITLGQMDSLQREIEYTAPSEEEVFYDIAVWINNNFLVPMAQYEQLAKKIDILEKQSRDYYNDHRR